MLKKIILTLFLCLYFLDKSVMALGITDSTTSNTSSYSTSAGLMTTKIVNTSGFQNFLGAPVGSLITWPAGVGIKTPDAFKWKECNGQTLPAADYRDLELVLGSSGGYITLPNLNGRFLRATTVAANVMKTQDNSLATHFSQITNPRVTSSLDSTALTSNLDNLHLTTNLKNNGLSTNSQSIHTKLTMTGTADAQTFTSTEHSWKLTGTSNGQRFTSTDMSHISGSAKASTSDIIDYSSSSNNYATDSNGVSGVNKVDKDRTTYYTSSIPQTFVKGTLKGSVGEVSLTGLTVHTSTVSGSTQDADMPTSTSKSDVNIPVLSGSVDNGHSSGNIQDTFATGNVKNPNVYGSVDSTRVSYEGNTETVPMHVTVRYFIKVIP